MSILSDDFSKVKQTLAQWWEGTKAFFHRSETVLYARIQVLVGFLTAVAGAIDWSQIAHWNFTTPNQTAWLGIGLVANGVITEALRRRNMYA
jgi:hypothetical protein